MINSLNYQKLVNYHLLLCLYLMVIIKLETMIFYLFLIKYFNPIIFWFRALIISFHRLFCICIRVYCINQIMLYFIRLNYCVNLITFYIFLISTFFILSNNQLIFKYDLIVHLNSFIRIFNLSSNHIYLRIF